MNDNEKTPGIQMLLADGTLLTGQETSRRFVEALSCMLLGKPADHSAAGFGSELLLMVGPELDREGMLWLGGIAGENMRSVVYVTVVPKMPNVPKIALAAIVNDKIHIHQRCMLTLAKGSARARLVPQSFNDGGYRFDTTGALHPTATATDMATAIPDMTRAYVRMGKLLSRRPKGAWAPDLLSAA